MLARILFFYILTLTKSEFCLVREPTFVEIVNCTRFSYCCDKGCCSDAWYTWPLGILLMIILLCCITCAKAWWDVYSNRIENTANTENVRIRYTRRISNSDNSPPPAYHVAIYFPQPVSDRVPSYEEVMRQ